jgi:hypothetical protein
MPKKMFDLFFTLPRSGIHAHVIHVCLLAV